MTMNNEPKDSKDPEQLDLFEFVPEGDNDFELPAKACDLSGEGECEACQ